LKRRSEWIKECANAEKKKRKPTLLWPIFRIHGPFLTFLSVCGILAQFSVLYQATCMKELINHTNELTLLRKETEVSNGTSISSINEELEAQISNTKYQIYLRCFIMVLMQFLYTNLINVYNYHTVLIGYRLKVSCNYFFST
jgi:hypothetical protein